MACLQGCLVEAHLQAIVRASHTSIPTAIVSYWPEPIALFLYYSVSSFYWDLMLILLYLAGWVQDDLGLQGNVIPYLQVPVWLLLLKYLGIYLLILRCNIGPWRTIISHVSHVLGPPLSVLSKQLTQYRPRTGPVLAHNGMFTGIWTIQGHIPINMPLCASTGPVLGQCSQHRISTGLVLTTNGMFTGIPWRSLASWVTSTCSPWPRGPYY